MKTSVSLETKTPGVLSFPGNATNSGELESPSTKKSVRAYVALEHFGSCLLVLLL